MTIPDFQTIMLPLLEFTGDGEEHSMRETNNHIAELFNLSDDEKRELQPSGQQFIIDNRVGWARTYLKKAGLLESPRRSFIRVTDLGLETLRSSPPQISVKFLRQFPGFIEFTRGRANGNVDATPQPEDTEGDVPARTPEELLDDGYQKMRRNLAQELLAIVKQCPPRFFERLVVDLLLTMGYGGSRDEAGKVVGRSSDGGIDGIINEDKLGLDVIYIQAKRWEGNVGSGDIRNFVGSLVGKSANKGVFITSSGFTREALDFVKTIGYKVVLIDGETLAQLMIEHGVGVSTEQSYEVKRIDTDYFAEE